MNKRLPLWTIGCISAAIVFVAVGLLAVKNSMQDDAYISFRYAHNLADGNGLYYNVGQNGPIGYTNPLYVYGLAVLTRLTVGFLSFEVLARIGAILSGMGLASLVLWFGRPRNTGAIGLGVFLAVTVTLMLSFPYVLPNLYSGLETAVLAFAVALMLFLALPAVSRHDNLFATGAGLAAALRFDAALCIAPIVCFYIFVRVPRNERFTLFVRLAVAGVLAVVVLLAHWPVTGHLVPLSFLHKSQSGFRWSVTFRYAGLWCVTLVPVLIGAFYAGQRKVAGFIVGYMLYIAIFYGFFQEWNFRRYIFPMYFPSFLVLYAIGSRHAKQLGSHFCLLALCFMGLVFIPRLYDGYRWCSGARVVMQTSVKLVADALNSSELPPEKRVFASDDAGYVAYKTEWQFLDLVGLTTPDVLHKGLERAVRETNPTVLLVSAWDEKQSRVLTPHFAGGEVAAVPDNYRLIRRLPLTHRYWWPSQRYAYYIYVNEQANEHLVQTLQEATFDIEQTLGYQARIIEVLARLAR